MSNELEATNESAEGCIDADQALRLIDDDLREDERECCLRHIDRCSVCRKYVSDLTRVLLHGSSAGAESAAPRDDVDLASLGSQLIGGTYRLERIIGTGAMGVVYEASHTRLPRSFAVKVLRRGDEDARKRFRREAQIAAELDHRNIARVLDFGTTPEGHAYLVMNRLEGEDLSARIAKAGKLPPPAAIHIAEQVAAALDAAHARGVVHRDVKPSNIFLSVESDGTEVVKLLDFGVSKALDTVTRTKSDMLVGTPHYMSPEQARGERDVDRRADVFSFAAVIYHMLTGQPPFDGDSVEAVLYQLVHESPVPISRFTPAVPPALDVALQRGMSKRAEERFSSAGDLIRHCKASSRPPRRHIVRGGVALFIGLAAIVLFNDWRTSDAPAQSATGAPATGSASPAVLTSTVPTVATSVLPAVPSKPDDSSASSTAPPKRRGDIPRARPSNVASPSRPSASGDGFERMMRAGKLRNAAGVKVAKRDPTCMADLERARQVDPEHESSFVYLRAQCLAASGRCSEATAIVRRYYGVYMIGDALEAQIAVFKQQNCTP